MYSDRELNQLSAHKAVLRQRIARHRQQCVTAVTRVVQPLAWLDRMLGLWRQFAPFAAIAAVPLGFMLKRSSSPRPRMMGTLLRWAPVVLGAARGFVRARYPAARD
jgi:hypothetical protein